MTCRNSSMPNERPPMSTSSTIAILSVCMCTFGVSLYSRNASQPVSLLMMAGSPRTTSLKQGTLQSGAGSDDLFGLDRRPGSVNLVEEQSDCGGHGPGAGAVGHVEPVAGARQLGIADRRARDPAQGVDEVAGLLDRNDRVAAAVDDQERRRVGMDPGDRRRVAEQFRVAVDTPLDDDAFEEVDEPGALIGGAVLPVVAAIDPDHGVDRRVRVRRQVFLVLGVTDGQTGEGGEMATGRTACDGDEVAISAEPVHVGAGPGDRGLDV